MLSNRKIIIKAKEKNYTSIAEYNLKNNKSYYLFNPKNVTAFKCKIGIVDGKEVYIREHLECMWANDQIDEYILFDDFCLEQFENMKKEKAINNLNYDGIDVFYTYKISITGAFVYNVIYEIDSVRYYLYIKTIKQQHFFSLLKDYFNAQFALEA